MRVLARLRGMPPPPDDERWDQAAAAATIEPRRDRLGRRGLQRRVRQGACRPARRRADPRGARRIAADLAILSNWPLAATIDRYAEAAGWAPLPYGDRRQPAGRDDQAASGDLRRGSRPSSVTRPPRRSSTSATTGRRTSSAPTGPAGGPPTCDRGRTTRRCRRASATLDGQRGHRDRLRLAELAGGLFRGNRQNP